MEHKYSRAFHPACASWALTAATVVLGLTAPALAHAHFSLWAMLAVPLMAGNNLSKMDADTRRILTNGNVMAVEQHPLGQQGRRVWQQAELDIWARRLNGGEHAVVLFNRGKAPAEMKVGWHQLNLPAGLKAHVEDLWTQKVSQQVRGSYGGTVAPQGVVMACITPVL